MSKFTHYPTYNKQKEDTTYSKLGNFTPYQF